MTRRRQVAILTILAVVCVGIYARAWRSSPGSPAAPVQPQASSGSTPIVAEPPIVDRSAQHQHADQLTWERDPFLAGGNQTTGDVVLSGILWDATHPLAIINGATVSVGDAVDGFQVLDIQPDHVTLTNGATTYDVRIAP